ncbi:MAG: hypothetical protein JXR26_03530, partial [Balneolaceae bacterium]|nr:hypothetical protein [Balneolaceae bacterium]
MKFCYSCLTFLFLGFAFLPDIAAGQEKEYFDGAIIIKYKSDRQLRTIQSQAHIDPEEDIRQMLQKAGATSMQSVFKTATSSGIQRTAQAQQATENLQRIYEVRYSSNTDAATLAAKMNQLAGIEYAEPKYIRRMQFTPNDPVTNSYQTVHGFEQAWDVTRGSSDVVIAVVDGGVNYLHFDLGEKLWINTDEVAATVRAQVDQNSDGTITSSEVMQYLSQQNGDYNGDGSINLSDALAPGSPLLTGS